MRKPSAKWLFLVPILLFGLSYLDLESQRAPGSWQRASRESLGLAPDPAVLREGIVQVYAARAVRWRGYFGVHTWIAAKPTGADQYTVYEVTRWRMRRAPTSVSISNRVPDARWYGNAPELIAELRGAGVDEVIERIDAAARAYPYASKYRVWPGPNSNTFTAFVLREVPELRVDLPPTAIGKDYLGSRLVARTPSGTGGQLSVLGLAGILAGVEEGLELNLLGLTFGLDPKQLAVKLPLAGDFGFIDTVRAAEEEQ
jgi:Protein of unknown function (DUF3750)